MENIENWSGMLFYEWQDKLVWKLYFENGKRQFKWNMAKSCKLFMEKLLPQLDKTLPSTSKHISEIKSLIKGDIDNWMKELEYRIINKIKR